MEKLFEDEFMDVQSEFVSLCLEVAEQEVDKVYIYCSIEKKSKMFNAFFDINGQIRTLNQLGINDALIMQFLELGTHDLEKIENVCRTYNKPIPTEMKMYYNARTGKYNAQYQYVEVCSAKTGKSSGEVFWDWVCEIRG